MSDPTSAHASRPSSASGGALGELPRAPSAHANSLHSSRSSSVTSAHGASPSDGAAQAGSRPSSIGRRPLPRSFATVCGGCFGNGCHRRDEGLRPCCSGIGRDGGRAPVCASSFVRGLGRSRVARWVAGQRAAGAAVRSIVGVIAGLLECQRGIQHSATNRILVA